MRNTPDSPNIQSGFEQMIMMGKSIRQMWVNRNADLNHHKVHTIWAATWQNQQSECAPSKDSDQPSLIKVFAVRMKKPWVLSYPLSTQRSLWSDWANAQADLSLRWAQSHFVGFVMSWLILLFSKTQLECIQDHFHSPEFDFSYLCYFSAVISNRYIYARLVMS